MYKEYLENNPLENIPLDSSVFPTAEDRAFWEGLPVNVRVIMTQGADELLGEPWPQVLCSQTLAFNRTGDRLAMENPHFKKRKRLARLVAAECFEHKGRYLDEIMNGLVFIASEPFWGVSAHYPTKGVDLGDGERQNFIDLFAAETASLIARTLFLLRKELESECPELVFYLEGELERRIKSVFLAHDEFWWMGGERGRVMLNNWTPWITSQLMYVFLLCEKDENRKRAGIRKCMEIQDRYLRCVPADGGIDEGPSYWGVAGGKMLESVDLLYSVSGGRLDFGKDPQLFNITDFIRKAYVGNGFYVNFNDASPIGGADPCMICSFAENNGSEELMSLAYETAEKSGICAGPGNLSPFFLGIKYASALKGHTADKKWASRDVFLPGIQVAAARERAGDTDGFFFAAKGNHNRESHNHNDIGNFILYKNALPLVIDLGQGTYTKQTFSEDRYSISNCRSLWHNVPVVNGAEQFAGDGADAENFVYGVSGDGNRVTVGMDMTKAYTESAKAEKISRKILFDRTDAAFMEISDSFLFTDCGNEVIETLILCGEVRTEKDRITVTDGSVSAVILPEGVCVIGEPEEYTEDRQICERWGRKIFRVRMFYACPGKEADIKYTIRA